MKKLIRPLGFLLFIILLCGIIARVLNGSETLAEYAEQNPETAYVSDFIQ